MSEPITHMRPARSRRIRGAGIIAIVAAASLTAGCFGGTPGPKSTKSTPSAGITSVPGLPDAALEDSLVILGSTRGAVTAVVAQSRLAAVMRDGLPGSARIGGTAIFEVRTRLQSTVQLIE